MFFGAGLDDDGLRSLLSRHRTAVQAKLTRFERMRSEAGAADRAARLRLATLDNGIAHLRTELAWLDAVEEELA